MGSSKPGRLRRGSWKHFMATQERSPASISPQTACYLRVDQRITQRRSGGELVGGPFKTASWVGAIRLSPDSKKLAVNSWSKRGLGYSNTEIRSKREVRVIRNRCACVLDKQKNRNSGRIQLLYFSDSFAKTIYEFDASRVETVGAPFKGHTHKITGLALSSDGALIASTSFDGTIKLWAFDSRQLLAPFHVVNSHPIFSPDTQQLAYGAYANIYICNIPPNILATMGLATKGHSKVHLYPYSVQ
ncbi:hypothetical protein AZE42_11641 [Rhizopogon vesiculosus]|uniref:Uncharacterized protein n=1 Tax=Rhizopogon vesiculosus TaxID=180088 RepID=A0A1J8R1Q4_9AGAM|nr:hypothetical protein AZE42_11641 [Rhizopogon vesiculosus]